MPPRPTAPCRGERVAATEEAVGDAAEATRRRSARLRLCVVLPLTLAIAMSASGPAFAAKAASLGAAPWWVWPLALFFVCFVLGIVAVPAGVGGGVLFVPVVGGFFPFHLDFVRGGGLLVALASAMAASPDLLRLGLANLRLALPLSVLVAASQIAGALVGLVLPAAVAQTALGAVILGIVALMWRAKKSEFPDVPLADALSVALGINGLYHDTARRRDIEWKVHRTPTALLAFVVIGVLAGMFGLGAGWANVPTLNMLMGVPLKVAAGTSSLVLSSTSSAAWIYLNQGAILPIVAAPSVVGMMLGARIGARLLHVVEAVAIRRLVIAILLFAGARALGKGLGIWG